MRRYGEAIKADVRRRMSPPNRQRVARISEETGIHVATLYVWRKGWRLQGGSGTGIRERPRGLERYRQVHGGAGDRWFQYLLGRGRGGLTAPADRRKSSHRLVSHRLSEEERQRILLTCNQPEFAALPPGQIVSILADRGLYNSFSSRSLWQWRRLRLLVPRVKRSL